MKKEFKNPAESESASKKIWFIESAAAIVISFLAIIVASIY